MRQARSHLRRWPGVSLAGICLLLAVAAGMRRPAAAAQDPPQSKLSSVLTDLAGAVGQEQGLPAAQAAAGPVTPLAVDTLPKSVRDALHGRRLRMNDRNEVQVYVLMLAVTDATVEQLESNGAIVEISDAPHRRVQARIPVARLQAVAALPFVTFIRPPTYAVRQSGSAQTEGDAILHSDAVRSQWSLDGSGIKVGVISDGLKGVFATGCTSCGGAAGGPLASGDLPASSGVRNASGVLTSSTGGITGRSFQSNGDLEGRPPASPPCGFAGAGGEGTALLEIVHDLAPGAQLSFANADTDLAFNQAVNYLASSNDIVLDDFGFYGEAYDGTSPVSSNTASALNNPANRIRAYVTSVGNAADEHYIGTYVDSGVDGRSMSGISTPGDVHLFQQSSDTTDVLGLGPQPYNLILLPAGGEVAIFLTWDDGFGRSGNNYDLYLVQQSSGSVVARSTDSQTGSQDPLEILDYTNSGAAGYFRIVVQNVRNQARPAQLSLFSFQPECANGGPRLLAPNRHERHNFNTATRSVSAQSDAGGSPVSVISVAAICSASAAAAAASSGGLAPDESCVDRNNGTIEFFSSRGPTLDGRTKPDVTAIDGVSITGAGSFPVPFFGTSAASPHVGGIAALVLQAAPCLVAGGAGGLDSAAARGSLRNLILDNATPLGATVPGQHVRIGTRGRLGGGPEDAGALRW